MCGVTGIFAYRADAPVVDKAELERISTAQWRRGPDGEGLWIAANGRLGLAHTRLAVLDLSERAAQPMHSDDARISIVYNGELYNFRALRSELEAKGYTFKTGSDTEVLLRLYEDRGDEMLSALRGMYAFVIWDESQRRLFGARDVYGIKPLYYSDDGGTLRIASQVKALLAGRHVGNTIDPAGLCGFYLFGSVPEPFTLYESIKALPAGACLSVSDNDGVRLRQFDSITRIFSQVPSPAPSTCITDAVRDSVASHLVSDVPVAVFLSAGVDSGSMLGVMRDHHQGPIDAVTLEFESYRGTDDDEAPIAEKVAGVYEATHHRHVVGNRETQDVLQDFFAVMDQPSIDGLNTYLVSRYAQSLGIKVALSGVGGDELFAGYPSFRDVPRWARLPVVKDGVAKAWRTMIDAVRNVVTLSPKLAGLLELGGTWPGAYLLRRGLFMPWELPDLVGADLAQAGMDRLNPFWLMESKLVPAPLGDYGFVAALESNLYLRNQLLRDTDWAGMAHGVEIRTPWVDRSLASVVAPDVAARKARGGKALLASAPQTPLPRAVCDRPKSGFTVPLANWLESLSALDAWRHIPMLRSGDCHWARRWAYTVMSPVIA